MIKKGIILAGGLGTRMSPLTKAVNKQLLPIYDKPLIFYPLSILMLANIKDILIIVNKGQLEQYKKILPNGENLGIKISYKEQEEPRGLPDAFILGEKFIKNNNVALILGDNFFYGQNLTHKLEKSLTHNSGARIFLKQVNNPENFGVAKIKKNKIEKIIEKPKKPISNYAITGLYFYDSNVTKIAKKLKPSKRGELEITDINKEYLSKKMLEVKKLGRGFAWLDTGTHNTLLEASQFIETIEKRQGLKIACIEEIALNEKYISLSKFKSNIKRYNNNQYGKYLLQILKKNI